MSSTRSPRYDELLAMTPQDHLSKAAEAMARPASSHEWTNRYLHALVHLGMAQVKQGTRAT